MALENLIKVGLTSKKPSPTVKDNAAASNDDDEEEENWRRRDLAFLAVKCVCDLLVTHPHFNYR